MKLMNMQEIADRMGIKVSTFYSRRSRYVAGMRGGNSFYTMPDNEGTGKYKLTPETVEQWRKTELQAKAAA